MRRYSVGLREGKQSHFAESHFKVKELYSLADHVSLLENFEHLSGGLWALELLTIEHLSL